MRSLLWPNRRTKPPYGAVEIDWAHPLANGLQFCTLFNEGAGPATELVRRLRGPLAGNASYSASPFGSALTLDGTGDYSTFTPPDDPFGGKLISLIARITSTSFKSYGRLVDRLYTGQFAFYQANSGVLGVSLNTVGTDVDSTFSPASFTMSAGTWYDIGITYDGETVRLYSSAIYKTQNTTPSGVLAASSSPIRVGAIANTGGEAWAGQIERVLLYDRCLTQPEVLAHSADPYCFLRPIVRRSFGFVAAGGGVTAYLGSADLAVAAAVERASLLAAFATALLPAGATTGAGSLVGWGGTGSLSTVAAASPGGGLGLFGAGTLPTTEAVTGAGTLGLFGAGTLPTTEAVIGSGLLGLLGSQTLGAIAALTPATLAAHLVSASLGTSAAVVASRAGIAAYLSTAALDVSATLPASGQLGLSGSAALAQIATLGASAQRELILSAALNVLAGVQGAGAWAGEGNAPLSASASVQGAVTTASYVSAALAILAAAEAQGTVGISGTAALAAALALTSSHQDSLAAIFIEWLAEALVAATMTNTALTTPTMTDDTLTPAAFSAETLRPS